METLELGIFIGAICLLILGAIECFKFLPKLRAVPRVFATIILSAGLGLLVLISAAHLYLGLTS